MAVSQTTDSLISSIRSRCYENVGALSDVKILRIMNEELLAYLVPFLEAAHTDLFTTHVDTAIVGGQRAYYVPTAALSNKIRDICVIDGSGNVIRVLTELDLDVLMQGPGYRSNSTGQCTGYYFEGEQLILYPTPASTDGTSFRLYYARTPSELVLSASTQLVTASSTVGGNTRLTVASSSAFTNGQAADLVAADSPFSVVSVSVVNVVDATHVDVTLLTAPASGRLAAGAFYLCQSGQAPVPTGVPATFWNGLFVQWMVARLMAARGDSAAYDKAMKDVAVAEARAKLQLRQRNKGDTHQLQSLPYRFKGGYGGFRRSY